MIKRRLPILLVIVAAASLMLPPAASAVPVQSAGVSGCTQWYQVRRGDTLYRIAVNSGTTVAHLQALNGLPNPNVIYVGQNLCLRTGSAPSPCPPSPCPAPPCPSPQPPCPSPTPACPAVVPTCTGPTPCPLPSLPCQWTPVPTTTKPAPTPAPPTPCPSPCPAPCAKPPCPPPQPPDSGFWYIVRPGDTLYSVGRTYGWSAAYLASVNHLPNPNQIYAGQRLWIPGH